MMRTAIIRIRREHEVVAQEMRTRFIKAWKKDEYQGEFFDFESPASLFRVLTPKRWELLETLQAEGPMGMRATCPGART